MKQRMIRLLLVALLTGGLMAVPAQASKVAAAAESPGSLKVVDEAGFFSPDAIKQAEKKLADAKFDRGLHFTVDTYKAIPTERAKSYNPEQKAKFFTEWAKAVATGDKAKGPYVLICQKPGYTQVIADAESRNRGFDRSNEQALAKIFDNAMKRAAQSPVAEQQQIRDQALLEATDYVINDLSGTKVASTGSETAKGNAGTSSIGGWICMGLCLLLGIWLMVGLFRALSGGGGGGSMGGPGGGGFMSSLFGGLFGAMAGMWLYNSFFSGGGMFGGSDALASDGAGGADTGAGDYGNDTGAGTGGDYGGGGDVGGDYGGGDWGGGGDF